MNKNYNLNFINFSFIIPAHNEEAYISKTINSIKKLDYPKDNLEVIVVENGSTDNTHKEIMDNAPDWFKVLKINEYGVSRAKNAGIENLTFSNGWVIFLDADTYIEKDFLTELKNFFHKNHAKNLTCGMVSLLPYPDSKLARVWYRFYNFANKITKTSRSIQIIRRDLLNEIRFDEKLSFDEDTYLLKECKKYGEYFFFKTKKVFSSTRRFERVGWIKQLFIWIYMATRSYEKKKQIKYPVLR
ncbi:MAG: glycosyltransferase family 2 protein [Candidatus Marinimicrobia bacterium]|nr:glycosyltransferase family 2 protein [Candidatus Neomarinimicrobiota bacterium]